MNALIVEDNEAIRFLLGRMLAMHGFTVSTAEDGDSARAVADQMPMPSLLVVDFNLPNTDTVALIDALQAKWPGVPTVIASGLPTALLPARAATMVQMPKPYTFADLTAMLERLLPVSLLCQAA